MYIVNVDEISPQAWVESAVANYEPCMDTMEVLFWPTGTPCPWYRLKRLTVNILAEVILWKVGSSKSRKWFLYVLWKIRVTWESHSHFFKKQVSKK